MTSLPTILEREVEAPAETHHRGVPRISLTRILHQAENPNPKHKRGAPSYLAHASGWDWCIETGNCPTGEALRYLMQKASKRGAPSGSSEVKRSVAKL